MISATTQTLAEFLARELPTLDTEQISFDHPMFSHSGRPGLNVYCYHVQTQNVKPLVSMVQHSCDGLENEEARSESDPSLKSNSCQWIDLLFLISATDYTALGAQHLLSEIFTVLSSHKYLPEDILAPELQGKGLLPICVSNQDLANTVRLWNVLQAPLRPALQVGIAVPSYEHQSSLKKDLSFKVND